MFIFEALRHLSQMMQVFFLAHQYLALFIFLVVEETGIPLPVPGDALVSSTGFLATQGRSNPFLVVPIAAAATAAGSSILYWVSHRLGHPFVVKYGRFIRLDQRRLDRIEKWFRKHGASAIIIGRLIPGMRTPTTVMSGVFEIPYHIFIPATTIAAIIWACIYFSLGFLLGREYRLLGRFIIANYRWAIAIIAIVLVSAGAYYLARRMSFDPKSEEDSEAE